MKTKAFKKTTKLKQFFYIGPSIFVAGVGIGGYFIYDTITNKTFEIKKLKNIDFQKLPEFNLSIKKLNIQIKELNNDINKIWEEIIKNDKIKPKDLAEVLKEFLIFVNYKNNDSKEIELYEKLKKRLEKHNLNENTISKIKKLITLTHMENLNQNKLSLIKQKKDTRKINESIAKLRKTINF